MSAVERHAPVVGVRPDRREEYLAPHRAVWPQVEATLTAAHITNYSIFRAEDTLFAYYKYVGDDHDIDMARIGDDPVTREWWAHADPCQVRVAEERDPGELWQPLDEIWHLK